MKNFYIDILEENRYTTDVIVAQGPKGDQGEPGETPPVDQAYNPDSEYAQSGTAVAEAIEPKADALELGTSAGKAVCVTDSADGRIIGLSVYGESSQDGTPSPESPVEIVSVENPVVEVLGRNILSFPYDGTADTYYQPGTDGSIAVAVENNQDTKAFTLRNSFTFLAGQTYMFSGIPDDFIIALYYKDENNANAWWTYKGTPHTFDETLTGRLYIQLNPGKNYTGTIYPMLSVGTQETAYEPYKQPQTVTIPCTLRGIRGSDGSWSARDEIVVDGKQKTVQLVRRVVQAVLDGSADEHYQCNNIPNVPHLFTCFNYGTTSYFDHIQHTFTQRDLGLCETYVLSGQPLAQSPDKSFRATDAIYFINQDVEESVEAWRAYLAEHPITCYLALAEPEVTDITDTEAGQALLALVTHYPNTTVVCDADCALRYKADTTIAYNNLLARVAALEAAAVGQI